MLIASLIGVIFLGETVVASHMIGIVFLFLGIVIVSLETGEKDPTSTKMFSSDLFFPLLAMLIIGIEAPLVSIAYSRGVPVTVGLATSRTFGLGTTTLFFRYKGWNLSSPFQSDDRGLYLGAAIALTGGSIFTFVALNLAPVSVVTPLRGTGPLFVLLISYFYLKRLETITKKLVIGVILTVIGAVLIGLFM